MRPTASLVFAAVALSDTCRANTPEPARAPDSPAAAAAALARPSPEDRAIAAAEADTPEVLAGKVLETMDAGGYTYLRLDTAAGPAWAAVEQSTVKKGARVTVVGSVAMDGFESRTLGRRFDRIVFGALEAAGEAEQAAPARSRAVAGGPVETGSIEVARATTADGRTVAEVFAQRAALDTKSVAVRGKVVKFLPGIMGRNWLHLRDGTGSPAGEDHDLTVTTSESAAVGDVVLVRGTVRKDLDFGAGYAYAVLVEEAKLSR
jgi:hypothetical protein